jgi:hypothetical protein
MGRDMELSNTRRVGRRRLLATVEMGLRSLKMKQSSLSKVKVDTN